MIRRRRLFRLGAGLSLLGLTTRVGLSRASAQPHRETFAGFLLLPDHHVPAPASVVYHNAGKFPIYEGDSPSRTITRDLQLEEAARYAGAGLYRLDPKPKGLRQQLAHVIVHESGGVTRISSSYTARDPRHHQTPAVTITVDPVYPVPVPIRPGRDPALGYVSVSKLTTGLPAPGISYPAGDRRVAQWIERSGLVSVLVNEALAGVSLADTLERLRRV